MSAEDDDARRDAEGLFETIEKGFGVVPTLAIVGVFVVLLVALAWPLNPVALRRDLDALERRVEALEARP